MWRILAIHEELRATEAFDDDDTIKIFALGVVHVHDNEALGISLLGSELLLVKRAPNQVPGSPIVAIQIPLVCSSSADLVGRAEESNETRGLPDFSEPVRAFDYGSRRNPIASWISNQSDAGGSLLNDVLRTSWSNVLAVAQRLRISAVTVAKDYRSSYRPA